MFAGALTRYAAKEWRMKIDLTNANENMDMQAHVKTYTSFMTFVKFAVLIIALILIGMAVFLT